MNALAKHTPGPWELRGSRLVTDSQGVVIAEKISANHPGTPEGNALLIAAAPELAMAALSAREMLREMLRTAASNDQAEAIDEVSSALTAALAKAGLLS